MVARNTLSAIAIWMSAATALLPAAAWADLDPHIDQIRREVRAITDETPNMKARHHAFDGHSTGGGEATVLEANGLVRRVHGWTYGEGEQTRFDYYFAGGAVIFAIEEIHDAKGPVSIDATHLVPRTSADRFYFTDGKLIRWVDRSGRPLRRSSAQFGRRELSTLSFARLLLELVPTPPTPSSLPSPPAGLRSPR